MSTARLATWDEMIESIDRACIQIKEKFLIAFAEGQAEPDGRELIKQALFKHIWQKLAVAPSEFYELSDVDEHYQKIQRELLSYVSDFSRRDDVRKLVGTLKLADPFTEAKIDMLRKICILYHALARNRFIFSLLKNTCSADKCEEEVFVMEQESQVNAALLEEEQVNSYLLHTVNPLMHLNDGIITSIHEKGYGITAPRNNRKYLDEQEDGEVFARVIDQLQALPTEREIYDLMMGQTEASKADRARQLAAHAASLRQARDLLIILRDDLLNKSEASLRDLNDKYNALLLVKDKINHKDNLDLLFRLLFALKNSQELSGDKVKPDYPVLHLAAFDAVEACGKQSPTDNLFSFYKAGWNAAGEKIKTEVDNIIKATRVIDAVFAEHQKNYKSAIARVNRNNLVFQDLAKLIKGWDLLNRRVRETIDVVCGVLGKAEASVNRSQQTTWQYARGFLKRNALFIAGGALVIGGAGAALAFTVFTPIAAAALIPGGTLLGGAGGAGVGAIKDHVKPSQAAAAQSPHVVSADHQPFDTKAMLSHMFGEERAEDHIAPAIIHHADRVAATLAGLEAQGDDLSWPEQPSYPERAMSMVPGIWNALPIPERAALPALSMPSLSSIPGFRGSK